MNVEPQVVVPDMVVASTGAFDSVKLHAKIQVACAMSVVIVKHVHVGKYILR
jgi:hypothetical protein